MFDGISCGQVALNKVEIPYNKYYASNELNNIIGVDAIKVNSGLVSAQTRRRNYWSNLKITQPKDRKLVIADILDYGNTESKHIADFSKYNPRPCKNYYQFDVPDKGYTDKNTVVCTNKVNQIKNMLFETQNDNLNLTVKQAQLFLDKLKKWLTCHQNMI